MWDMTQSSHSVVSDSLWPHRLQHSRPPYPSQLLEFTQSHVHWVGDAIQQFHPLSSPSPPAFNLSPLQGLFKWVSSSHQVAEVLELQLQHQSFQWIFRTDFLYDGLVGSLCNPKDPQESSPTSQFKSINSSVLNVVYSANLTSVHDCWKNHSLDEKDLCWQSNISAFQYTIYVGHNFSSKEQMFFNFMAAVILEPPKIKSLIVSNLSPSICHKMMGPEAMILVFWMLSFKPTFSLSTFTFIKRFFVPLHFLL